MVFLFENAAPSGAWVCLVGVTVRLTAADHVVELFKAPSSNQSYHAEPDEKGASSKGYSGK